MDIKAMNKAVVEEFRANAGKVGGHFEGMPLLLLHTRGAKTNTPRVNPLAYLADGTRLIIIASFAGAPHSPPWFYNLVTHPEVEVEVGAERFRARAAVLGEPDRTLQYQKVAALMPVFAEYQQKTTRTIPVVALHRI